MKGNISYRTWRDMISRCANEKNRAYNHYGGRGITVCERWTKFENFYADMGDRPDGLQIDRKDNDGNYEPGNCRWATHTENGNNRRTSRYIDYNGQSKTLKQWANEKGMAGSAFSRRIERLGIHRAMTEPIKKVSKLTSIDVLNIIKLLRTDTTQTDIASMFGVDKCAINCIKMGRNWSWLTGIQKIDNSNRHKNSKTSIKGIKKFHAEVKYSDDFSKVSNDVESKLSDIKKQFKVDNNIKVHIVITVEGLDSPKKE